MAAWQRFVFWAQWVPVIAVPIWWVNAPGGGDPGWNALGMIVFGPLAGIAVAVTALVSVTRRANRAAQAVSRPSAWAVPFLWCTGWLPPVFLGGSGDVTSAPSFAQQWWGFGSWAGGGPGFLLTLLLFVAACAVALVAASQDTDVLSAVADVRADDRYR